MIRGVRGATTVERNDPHEIVTRSAELLRLLIERNDLRPYDVASIVFTVTADLDADFPASAMRAFPGWEDVPLLCAREIPVPGSLGQCVRILVHWNTDRPQGEVRHAFIRGARGLRPRWAVRLPGDEGSTGHPLG